MKQLRKVLFSTIVFSACLFISPAFIKAELSCSSTLKNGSSGTEVKELQTALNKVMGCNLTADGKFGSGTETCVKKYQQKKGLTADGKVGPTTCSKIKSEYASSKKEEATNNSSLACVPTLERGSSGAEVKELQNALNKVMGCNLTADGKFGSGTEACVKKYQEKKGITADGKAGKITCSKLKADYTSGSKEETTNKTEDSLTCKTTIKRGSEGNAVKEIQTMLKKVMGCSLTADGKFGSGTEACVKKYQEKKGISVDGKVGPTTCSKLKTDYVSESKEETTNKTEVSLTCSPTLKRGSSGAEVKELQKILKEVMGCNLTADGKYGSGTETCVKNYQEAKGIIVDGKAGKSTCSKLKTDYASGTKYDVAETVTNDTPEITLNCRKDLKSGSSGTSVKNLQTMLNKVMGCNLSINGNFNSSTKSCVKKYQGKKGLEKNGKVEIDTCSKLNVDYASSNKYIIIHDKSSKGLSIRAKASDSSTKLGSSKYGTVYKVYDTVKKSGTTWYKVKYNDKYGYVRGNVSSDGIIVDISDQTTRMYKDGKLVLHAVVITGKKNHDTPIGRYLMYVSIKAKNRTLQATPTSTPRVVDYWMKFIIERGIGFHDAKWRSEEQFKDINRYKNNGSLACVNMRLTDAEALYDLFTDDIYVYVVK